MSDISPATTKTPSAKLAINIKFRFRISTFDQNGSMSKSRRGLFPRLVSMGKNLSSGRGLPMGNRGGPTRSSIASLVPAGNSLNEDTSTVPPGEISAALMTGRPDSSPAIRMSSMVRSWFLLHNAATSFRKILVGSRGSRLVCWPVKTSRPKITGKSVTATMRMVNCVRSFSFTASLLQTPPG